MLPAVAVRGTSIWHQLIYRCSYPCSWNKNQHYINQISKVYEESLNVITFIRARILINISLQQHNFTNLRVVHGFSWFSLFTQNQHETSKEKVVSEFFVSTSSFDNVEETNLFKICFALSMSKQISFFCRSH